MMTFKNQNIKNKKLKKKKKKKTSPQCYAWKRRM